MRDRSLSDFWREYSDDRVSELASVLQGADGMIGVMGSGVRAVWSTNGNSETYWVRAMAGKDTEMRVFLDYSPLAMLRPPFGGRAVDEVIGYAAHEGGHCLWTEGDSAKDTITELLEKSPAFKPVRQRRKVVTPKPTSGQIEEALRVLNIVEDAFIDYHVAEKWPVLGEYIQYARRKIREGRPIDYSKIALQVKPARNHVINLWIACSLYSENIPDKMSDSVAQAIEFLMKASVQAVKETSHAERCKIAVGCWECLQQFPDSPSPMPGKPRGKPQGQVTDECQGRQAGKPGEQKSIGYGQGEQEGDDKGQAEKAGQDSGQPAEHSEPGAGSREQDSGKESAQSEEDGKERDEPEDGEGPGEEATETETEPSEEPVESEGKDSRREEEGGEMEADRDEGDGDEGESSEDEGQEFGHFGGGQDESEETEEGDDGPEDRDGEDEVGDEGEEGGEGESGGQASEDGDSPEDKSTQGGDGQGAPGNLDEFDIRDIQGLPEPLLEEVMDAIAHELEDLTKSVAEVLGSSPYGNCQTRRADYDGPTAQKAREQVEPEITELRRLFDRQRMEASRSLHGLNMGKLDPRRLARVGAGNFHVFKRREVIGKPDMDVGLLLDVSGSMDSHMGVVWMTAAVFGEGLVHTDGVNFLCLTYTGSMFNVQTTMICSRETGKLCLGNVDQGGGTPSGPAIAVMKVHLDRMPGKKKVIIHFTDGSPDDSSSVVAAVEACRKDGYEVWAIGLQGMERQLTSQYGEENYKTISTIRELPEKVGELLRTLVLDR